MGDPRTGRGVRSGKPVGVWETPEPDGGYGLGNRGLVGRPQNWRGDTVWGTGDWLGDPRTGRGDTVWVTGGWLGEDGKRYPLGG